MKFYIIAAVIGALSWGTFPAQADVVKNDFNLVVKASAVDMNDVIYLKARVKELEEENLKLKAKTKPTEFGLAYITSDGKLRRKADDNGNDWDWDGKTWYRNYGITATPISSPFSTCPDGKCPLKR